MGIVERKMETIGIIEHIYIYIIDILGFKGNNGKQRGNCYIIMGYIYNVFRGSVNHGGGCPYMYIYICGCESHGFFLCPGLGFRMKV